MGMTIPKYLSYSVRDDYEYTVYTTIDIIGI